VSSLFLCAGLLCCMCACLCHERDIVSAHELVYCSVLQWPAVYCSVLHSVTVCGSLWQSVAVCCSVLQNSTFTVHKLALERYEYPLSSSSWAHIPWHRHLIPRNIPCSSALCPCCRPLFLHHRPLLPFHRPTKRLLQNDALVFPWFRGVSW